MPDNNQIDGTSDHTNFSDMFSDCTRELVRHTEATNLMIRRNFVKQKSGYVGRSFGCVESLPTDIQIMVNAMKEIQSDIHEIESEYSKKVFKLKSNYEKLYKSLIKKRRRILSDIDGPTAAKVARGELPTADAVRHMMNVDRMVNLNLGEYPHWFITFLNTPLLSELIRDHDVIALKQLKHVYVTYSDDNSDVKFFDIHFVFAENKYFENKELTKRYFYTTTKVLTDFSKDYKIIKSSGCKINWNDGMNLTSTELIKIYSGVDLEPTDFKSFFDIFSEHDVKSSNQLTDEEKTVLQLSQDLDFQVGQILESSVVRNSDYYFTKGTPDDD